DKEAFASPPAKDSKAAKTKETLYPIIPLCGALQDPMPEPIRLKMTQTKLDEIVGLIYRRAEALGPALTDVLRNGWVRRGLKGVEGLVTAVGYGKPALTEYLGREFGSALEPM